MIGLVVRWLSPCSSTRSRRFLHNLTVEVEAFVDNKDIGFVHAGQEAQVTIETFPFTKYGNVAATVTQVSIDVIRQEKAGREKDVLF